MHDMSFSSSPLDPEDSFCIDREVGRALEGGDPVVALETTIITHGMPHPQNLETALEVEQVVRSAGAVPASIGVLDGTVHIGQHYKKRDTDLSGLRLWVYALSNQYTVPPILFIFNGPMKTHRGVQTSLYNARF